MSGKADYEFFTPAVARIAYEQITAWQLQELKLSSVPDEFSPGNEQRFAYILAKAGIRVKLLEDAGICTVERRAADLHGSNWGDPWYDVYVVNMRKLYEYAQQSMPAPDSVNAAAFGNNGKRTVRAPQLKFPKP